MGFYSSVKENEICGWIAGTREMIVSETDDPAPQKSMLLASLVDQNFNSLDMCECL